MASSQKGMNAFTGVSYLIGKRSIIEESKNYPKDHTTQTFSDSMTSLKRTVR